VVCRVWQDGQLCVRDGGLGEWIGDAAVVISVKMGLEVLRHLCANTFIRDDI
jgi:hypothetical protein